MHTHSDLHTNVNMHTNVHTHTHIHAHVMTGTHVEEEPDDASREDGCSTGLMNGRGRRDPAAPDASAAGDDDAPPAGLLRRFRCFLYKLGGCGSGGGGGGGGGRGGRPEKVEYGCLDIVRSRKLLLYAVVMCSLW